LQRVGHSPSRSSGDSARVDHMETNPLIHAATQTAEAGLCPARGQQRFLLCHALKEGVRGGTMGSPTLP